jgi:hypothetical protein
MLALSLDYSRVGWERVGGWVESEGYFKFQLLILHLCGILYIGFPNSLGPQLAHLHILAFYSYRLYETAEYCDD